MTRKLFWTLFSLDCVVGVALSVVLIPILHSHSIVLLVLDLVAITLVCVDLIKGYKKFSRIYSE